jgi:hypothetical protein
VWFAHRSTSSPLWQTVVVPQLLLTSLSIVLLTAFESLIGQPRCTSMYDGRHIQLLLFRSEIIYSALPSPAPSVRTKISRLLSGMKSAICHINQITSSLGMAVRRNNDSGFTRVSPKFISFWNPVG